MWTKTEDMSVVAVRTLGVLKKAHLRDCCQDGASLCPPLDLPTIKQLMLESNQLYTVDGTESMHATLPWPFKMFNHMTAPAAYNCLAAEAKALAFCR